MKKKLKSMVCALLLLFGVAAGHAQTEGLTVSKLTYDAGLNLWVVDLGLENPERAYSNFQCDLALPQKMTFKGSRRNPARIISVEDEMTGEMTLSHKYQQNFLENGTMRMLVSSDKYSNFVGNTGTLYTLRFADNGGLDKSKSYEVNLTNIELVYRRQDGQLAGYRQQGIINDPSLRCFDVLCNDLSVYGEILQEDLDWMNQALNQNPNATSVDLTYCTNAALGHLYAVNPNIVIYLSTEGQVDNTRNVVLNKMCAKLTLDDKMPFCPTKDFVANEVVFKMGVSEVGYSTVILPFACAVPSGLEAYKLTSVDEMTNTVKGESVQEISAHQPILLKGANNSYTFSGTAQKISAQIEKSENGLLEGTYLDVNAETGNYLLQRQAEKVAFFRVAANTTPGVKPFHAWLKNNQSAANLLSLDLNESTGIQHLYIGENGAEVIYNLNGQRLLKSERGVNILKNEDGTTRKVLVK